MAAIFTVVVLCFIYHFGGRMGRVSKFLKIIQDRKQLISIEKANKRKYVYAKRSSDDPESDELSEPKSPLRNNNSSHD